MVLDQNTNIVNAKDYFVFGKLNMRKTFLFFCFLAFISCNSEKVLTSEPVDISELAKEWVHSREEQVDSVQIYRPAGFKQFPSSRYRQKYIFKDDGLCSYYVLHPTDAHYYEDGTWTYDENDQRLVIYDTSKTVESKFRILILNRFMLKVCKGGLIMGPYRI